MDWEVWRNGTWESGLVGCGCSDTCQSHQEVSDDYEMVMILVVEDTL